MAKPFSAFVEVGELDRVIECQAIRGYHAVSEPLYRIVGPTCVVTLHDALRQCGYLDAQEVMVVPVEEWNRLTGGPTRVTEGAAGETLCELYECCGDVLCEECRAAILVDERI
jgi:hypothetical protein